MIRADRNHPLIGAFQVRLNGSVLGNEVAGWICRVSVEDELDVPGMFTFDLASREDQYGTRPWSDDKRFKLGMSVEVGFGYGNRTEVLLAGQITALEPSFRSSAPPMLRIRGYDLRYLLNTVRSTRSFVEQKDSDIAKKLCEDVGLTTRIVDSKVVHPYVLQAGRTDLEFLIERARRIQFELAMQGTELLYRPVANAGKEALALSFEDDLLEFEPRVSLTPATQLLLRSWDPKAKQPLTAVGEPARNQASSSSDDPAEDADGAPRSTRSGVDSSSSVLGSFIESDIHRPVASQAEADQVAQGQFDAMTLDFIRGEARARGCTGIRAGQVIRIDGVGKRFSGTYYVTSAVHSYTRSHGYLTSFHVRRNAW
jgi:uncharacterized protein